MEITLFSVALCFALDCAFLALPPPYVYVMPVIERGEIYGAGIKLHRPDGTVFYANAHFIQLAREPLSTETGNSVIVFTNGTKQSVLETVSEVIDLIAAEIP